MSHVSNAETRGDILRRTLVETGVAKQELARRLAGPGGNVESKRRQITEWSTPGAHFSDQTAERLSAALRLRDERFKVAKRRARRARLEDQVAAIRPLVVEIAQRVGVVVPAELLVDDE